MPGRTAIKSFQTFAANEDLLKKVVEAIRQGESVARSRGEIQSFEVFYQGFRQNISIGRVMVVPPQVADTPDNFPLALLHGVVVREMDPEAVQNLTVHKIGDSEFDEYAQKEFSEIKDRLFKSSKSGKYETLVLYVPNWSCPRDYIVFKYVKDEEQLNNLVRHLIFAAYFDPAVSSAFNQLMTEVDTNKLDVTNITPKDQYPFISKDNEKQYPDLKKTAAARRQTILFTKYASSTVQEAMLDKSEYDVVDELTSALRSAVKGEVKDGEEVSKKASLDCPACKEGKLCWDEEIKGACCDQCGEQCYSKKILEQVKPEKNDTKTASPEKPELLAATMLQSWRDRLPKAVKKVLGPDSIVEQGWTDSSSTSWTVLADNSKGLSLDEFEMQLRAALGGSASDEGDDYVIGGEFGGWLQVEDGQKLYDAGEGYEEEPPDFDPTDSKFSSVEAGLREQPDYCESDSHTSEMNNANKSAGWDRDYGVDRYGIQRGDKVTVKKQGDPNNGKEGRILQHTTHNFGVEFPGQPGLHWYKTNELKKVGKQSVTTSLQALASIAGVGAEQDEPPVATIVKEEKTDLPVVKGTNAGVGSGEDTKLASPGPWKPSMDKDKSSKPCGCREPKQHRDCAYCGYGGPATHVCGMCRERGIDGPVIRGTEGRTCAQHRGKKAGLPEEDYCDGCDNLQSKCVCKEAASLKTIQARKDKEELLNRYEQRKKMADVPMDFDSIWNDITEDLGPAPIVEIAGGDKKQPSEAPSESTSDQDTSAPPTEEEELPQSGEKED